MRGQDGRGCAGVMVGEMRVTVFQVRKPMDGTGFRMASMERVGGQGGYSSNMYHCSSRSQGRGGCKGLRWEGGRKGSSCNLSKYFEAANVSTTVTLE